VRLSSARGGEERLQLGRFAAGRFTGTVSLPSDGRWSMTVLVSRAGHRSASRFGWTVAPPDPARPVKVSARPLAPIADRAALVGLFVVTLLGGWLATRGWRRSGRALASRALRT
jgi:hypothetical protein